MLFHGLDTLQLTQEKEKSSVTQRSTGCFKNNFSECSKTRLMSQSVEKTDCQHSYTGIFFLSVSGIDFQIWYEVEGKRPVSYD